MKIGFMGAGAIGCYIGARLAASGASVTLIGRPTLLSAIGAKGVRVTDYKGYDGSVAANVLELSADPAPLKSCDVVAVSVKSFDTPAAAQLLAATLAPGQVVVSLQNGVRNTAVLRAALPHCKVLAGMVQFNVIRPEPTHFHCGMNGRIVVEDRPEIHAFVAALRAAGLEADASAAVDAIQWGKLLFNLNNAVNALAGVPLRAMLSQRAYRMIMAATVAEAVKALKAAKIPAVLNIPIPPALLPGVLRLPTPLFRLAAKKMLAVDPHARASMAEDLDRGRKTEVDFLNGEVVALGARVGVPTPVNAAIVALVRAAEASGAPALAASALAARIKAGK